MASPKKSGKYNFFQFLHSARGLFKTTINCTPASQVQAMGAVQLPQLRRGDEYQKYVRPMKNRWLIEVNELQGQVQIAVGNN